MNILFAAALFSVCLSGRVLIYGGVEFSNLKCISLDKSFLNMEYCFLRSVNRSYKYLSLKAHLFEVPIRDISITVALLKKANGFKPFLYNITVDVCKYLRGPNKYKFIKFVHDFYKPYSNMNHTCPYYDDAIVEKLPISHLNHRLVNLLPIPEGEYRVDMLWYTSQIPRVRVQIQILKT